MTQYGRAFGRLAAFWITVALSPNVVPGSAQSIDHMIAEISTAVAALSETHRALTCKERITTSIREGDTEVVTRFVRATPTSSNAPVFFSVTRDAPSVAARETEVVEWDGPRLGGLLADTLHPERLQEFTFARQPSLDRPGAFGISFRSAEGEDPEGTLLVDPETMRVIRIERMFRLAETETSISVAVDYASRFVSGEERWVPLRHETVEVTPRWEGVHVVEYGACQIFETAVRFR